jgi:hypothetical protein
VIVSAGRPSLEWCIRSIKTHVKYNKIIIVTTPEARHRIPKVGATIITSTEKCIGKLRAIGLDHVNTDYWASIDDDVIVSEQWFQWCQYMIQCSGVAACQGCEVPTGKLFRQMRQHRFDHLNPIKQQIYCSLGNTMLNAQIIRQLGIPKLHSYEDYALRYQLHKNGYKWVTNPRIRVPHVMSDIDSLRHAVRWGLTQTDLGTHLRNIASGFIVALFKVQDTQANLLMSLYDLCSLYGYLRSHTRNDMAALLDSYPAEYRTICPSCPYVDQCTMEKYIHP